ncbi:Uncharacterised protein [Mycobacteroides abscessus subsp. abscessus]|nr:Uncharacterised protein [Mycobacteroides abscessus subsp. abscessus]
MTIRISSGLASPVSREMTMGSAALSAKKSANPECRAP